MTDKAADSLVDRDDEAALVEQVRKARNLGQALRIQGAGTKDFYGNPVRASGNLDCTGHRGLIAYEPSELAITVRAGTPLAEVEALLAAQGQQLPFEPPHFGPASAGGGTLGGLVATGLSGPRRPYAGSVRDALLGVKLLNGRGEVLQLGGRVMKNVAGYDVSRLMAGALGVLGVLLEVSLKVSPSPPGQLTLMQECNQAEALARLRRWARQSLPISATAWHKDQLFIRLSGSEAALAEGQRRLGGREVAQAEPVWCELRDQRLAFFAGEAPLWRLAVRPATPAEVLPGELIEWGGALRWRRGVADPQMLRTAARAGGGHASLFRAGAAAAPADGVFTPLDPVTWRLHRQLKQAFDPDGLFNPGRLYPHL